MKSTEVRRGDKLEEKFAKYEKQNTHYLKILRLKALFLQLQLFVFIKKIISNVFTLTQPSIYNINRKKYKFVCIVVLNYGKNMFKKKIGLSKQNKMMAILALR